MLVYQAFRYELAPTAAQRMALANHAGAARWAWNWGLSIRRKAWQRRGETLGAVLNCPGSDGGLNGWGYATSLDCGCSR
jgi:hypothetical protein